jgi:hypothetical protein
MIDGVSLSTIKVNLFAIRRHLVTHGKENPLLNKERLKMVLEGVKRLQGRVLRKVPIPMSLIRSMSNRKVLFMWDDLITLTAVVIMFLFLLRSGEALRTGKNQDLEKVLRTDRVAFRRKGVQVTGDDILEADELLICVAKAKADQLGQGKVINLFAIKDDPLCPLLLLKRLYRLNDRHFNEKGARFLFTMTNGTLLHRRKVMKWLQQEAVLSGYPSSALSIISLRAGGASAMYAAGCSEEEIKRRGRWESDCWRSYVWGGEDITKNTGERLLSSPFIPLAALRLFRN